jgi:GUN4-like
MKNTKKTVTYCLSFLAFLFTSLISYNFLSEAKSRDEVDYQIARLNQNLKDKKYIQADISTAELFKGIIKYELNKKSPFSYEPDLFGDARIRKIKSEISCENLVKINDLWSQYSLGVFGFESQLKEFKKSYFKKI